MIGKAGLHSHLRSQYTSNIDEVKSGPIEAQPKIE
jgi:hypothetical protein